MKDLIKLIFAIFVFCKPPYNTPQYHKPPALYIEYYRKGIYYENRHNYSKALSYFKKACRFSPKERPTKRRYWRAYFRMVKQYENLKLYEKAYKGYLRIFKEEPKDQYSSYALYRAIKILCERLKKRRLGLSLLKELIIKYPDRGITTSSIKLLYKCSKGLGEALSFLKRIEPKVVNRDIDSNILFEIGKILIKLEKEKEGIEYIKKMIERYPYPYNSLWDDGVWYLSTLYERKGDIENAIKYYELLVSKKERSYFTATYNFLKTDDSLLKLGELYYYKKRDPKKAIKFLKILAKEISFPLSDEGMLLLAKIYRELKDLEKACFWLKYMKEKKDYANSLRLALKLYKEWNCR